MPDCTLCPIRPQGERFCHRGAETRGQRERGTRRQGDKETRREGDKETRGKGGQLEKQSIHLSPLLLVSLSPCLWLCDSVASSQFLQSVQNLAERVKDSVGQEIVGAAVQLHFQDAVRAEIGRFVSRQEVEQIVRFDAGFFAELDGEAFAHAIDRNDSQAFGLAPHAGEAEQVLYGHGQSPVAIRNLFADAVQLLVRPRRSDALVSAQPLAHVGYVIVRYARVHAEVQLYARLLGDLFAAQLLDGAFEHLRVKVEADGVDVSRLLAAEQIARAAQLQVERRYAKARAQVGELAYRGQSLSSDRRQLLLGRDEQVGVGAAIRSPDAPSQLIKLRQSVSVGAIDDDRVGARNVDAVFDDRRGDQHVEFVIDEIEHGLLHRFFAHLTVRDDEPRLRDNPADQFGDCDDRFDAVVNEEDLPLALQLLLDGAADDVLGEGHYVGLNRQAVARRRFDDRHVAHSHQRHVQRARDRRRAHGQNVHPLLHLLQPLFVRDPEPLLLVDDHESQVFEGQVA